MIAGTNSSNVADSSRNIPVMTEIEQQQLAVWNATRRDYSRDAGIPQLVALQALATPDAIALVVEEQMLNYYDLNRRANQLAHHLNTLGVGPEVLVGICIERSLDMVVGLLGILKAGGAYVPLDPTYPKERLAFMMADARAPVLLTQARLVEALPPHAASMVRIDSDWPKIASGPELAPSSGVRDRHLAYVIYTSGSTGK